MNLLNTELPQAKLVIPESAITSSQIPDYVEATLRKYNNPDINNVALCFFIILKGNKNVLVLKEEDGKGHQGFLKSIIRSNKDITVDNNVLAGGTIRLSKYRIGKYKDQLISQSPVWGFILYMESRLTKPTKESVEFLKEELQKAGIIWIEDEDF